MKKIKLSQGKYAIVDDEDYDLASQYRWAFDNTGYAKRQVRKADRMEVGSNCQYMHRLILGAKKGEIVDHINGNGLDNRRENLRTVNHAQNLMNSKIRRGTSRYKGVCWKRLFNKWEASIVVDKKQRFLGRYDNEDDAALAYNIAADKFFGEYARKNEVQ